jgi:hypothetical protein
MACNGPKRPAPETTMTFRRPIALAAALAAAALSACGGSTSGSATGPARISVRLVDTSAAAMASDPTSAYDEVNIDVLRVEIWSEAEGWHTIATPTCTNDPAAAPGCIVNLLRLTWDGTQATQGVTATLADGATLPAGRYGQMRLVLGSYNSVKLKGATAPEPLQVPSGQQSGVKLIVNFEVQAGTTKDVYIDFAAHRSVFVHGAGKSGKYILRPTVRAYDLLETGTIRGKLTDTAGKGLAGVGVTLQAVAGGVPAVVREGRTSDAAGHEGEYEFALVRRDEPNHVVAQPVVAGTQPEGPLTTVYEAKASPALTITAAAPIATWNAAFATAPSGTLNADLDLPDGAVYPFDATVLVRAPLVPDGGTGTVTVELRRTAVSVLADLQRVPFADLPAGEYVVVAEREIGGAIVPSPVNATLTSPGPVTVLVPVPVPAP